MKSWKPALAATALLALSACSDGYPSKSDTLFLAYGMSQPDTLAAMNQVGRSKHLPTKTAFVLLDGCVLEIHGASHVDGKDSQTAPLRGAEAVLVKNDDNDTYRVQLVRTVPNGEPSIPVLDGATWSEATQMKWLLDYTQGFC